LTKSGNVKSRSVDLVSIDPGATSGVAEFVEGVLVANEAIKHDKLQDYLKKVSAKEVVVEYPVWYPEGRSKSSSPNDLIRLSFRAGLAASVVVFNGASLIEVKPAEWKGQIPDDILYRRIDKKLSEEELKIRKSNHNARDAVGIGLWRLKRFLI